MLTDTHAHIYDEKYGDGGKSIIASMASDGLGAIVCVGCDPETSEKCVELAENNANVYATVGVHPYYPETVTDSALARFAELAAHEKVVAIGEFGLDYHHDAYDKSGQLKALAAQYELARSAGLPMVFHVREATGDFVDFLKDRSFPDGGVMHCFSGSVETAKICLDKGLFISFGGKLTYRNARNLAEVATAVPLDRIVIETDAPYLSPAQKLGEDNYPKYVCYVRDKLAELRGMSADEIESITTENAHALFKKMKKQ